MKPRTSEAIILHSYPARERDKLVVFLTPAEGKKRGWAYGARSMRSRFGASLEPLTKVRVGYLTKEGDDAVRIESVDLIRSLFPAQQNLIASVSASYIAELVDTFAQEEEASELIFRLLDKACDALLGRSPPHAVVAYVEIWMMRLAGIFPSLTECAECHKAMTPPLGYDPDRGFVCAGCGDRRATIVANGTIELLGRMTKDSVAGFARRRIDAETLFEIRSLARGLRRSFLGHELKSHDILQKILAEGE